MGSVLHTMYQFGTFLGHPNYCHSQIRGRGVEAWSGCPWAFSGRPYHPWILGHAGVGVYGHSLDVPVTVPSTNTGT